MANFRHRILVHRSSRLCINTPRPASSGASNQALRFPLLSLFSLRVIRPLAIRQEDYLSQRAVSRLIVRATRTSMISLSSAHCLDRAERLYQRNIPKLVDFVFDKSTLDSSMPRVLISRTQPRTSLILSHPLSLNSRAQVITYATLVDRRSTTFSCQDAQRMRRLASQASLGTPLLRTRLV